MYSTAKFVTVTGFRPKKNEPLPTIIIECDDGSEVVLREHFFKRHDFKLGDNVIVTIHLDPDQGEDE